MQYLIAFLKKIDAKRREIKILKEKVAGTRIRTWVTAATTQGPNH